MIMRVFDWCLRCYPSRFRKKFADDMRQVFAARLDRACARGALAFAACAVLGAIDAIASGLRERFFRESAVPGQERLAMQADSWLADARFSLRVLRRSPATTLGAVLTIALGLGATGAIFAAVDHILLRPLPYDRPDQLVMVWSNNTRERLDRTAVAPADAIDFQKSARTLGDLQPMLSFLVANQYVDGAAADAVQSFLIAPGMCQLLGRPPLLGRTFDDPNAHDVVLSYAFWQRRYGGDSSVVGRHVAISGVQGYTVVGVMPRDFVFPYRTMLGQTGIAAASADLWLPLSLTGPFFVDATGQPTRQARGLALVGRLAGGASVADAQVELSGIASRLASTYPTSNTGFTTTVVPLLDQTVGAMRPALMLLLAGIGLLFLMTLANVANFLLAQSLGRQRELALRSALGASRSRLARQSIVEGLTLALCGGLAGAALLYAGVPLLVASAPVGLPRLAEIRPDGRAFLFGLVLTIVAGIVVGLVPAFVSAGRDAGATLKQATRGSTSGPVASRLRTTLVVGEIVIAVLLTTASVLLVRSFVAVLNVDPGFRAERLLTFQLNVPARFATAPARLAYYDDLFGRLAAIPGVVSAGGTTRLPLGSTSVSTRVAVAGHDLPASDLPEVEFRRLVADYFRAMGIPIVRGRDFTRDDGPGATPVCILNEAAAARLFPGEDAVDGRVQIGPSPTAAWMTVVGVIGDIRHGSLEEAPKAELYIPSRQGPPTAPFVAVRTTGDPAALAGAVRRAIAAIDPLTPIYEMKPMTEVRRQSIAERRFLLTLVGLFGTLALALAALGVYGAMTVLVSERTTEVGVRLALGATPAQIVRLVLSRAGILAGTGVAIGLGLTIVGAPLMAHSLFGIAPRDLEALSITPAILLMAALVAAAVPARRAMHVDPIVTLRREG